MKKTIILSIMIICLLTQFKVAAENNNIYSNFIDYLKNEYNPSHRKPLSVLNYNKNKLLIEKGNNIKRGGELLIYTKNKNTPYYLTDPINIAIVRDELQEGYLAECVKDINKGEEPLIAVSPIRPIIYLPHEDKNIYHENLFDSLIQNGFIVKEFNKFDKVNGIKNYGILLHLNDHEDQAQITIRSLFFNNILYKKTLYSLRTSKETNNNHSLDSEKFINYDSNNDYNKTYKIHKLPNEYSRLRVAEIDGNDGKEFIFLGSKNLGVYSFKDNNFEELAVYDFNNKNLVPIHLHTMDINSDKKEEIILTMGKEVDDFGFIDTEIYSFILSFKNKTLIPLGEKIPYYLRIIENKEGKSILLGQKKGKYNPYEGKIMNFSWDAVNNKLANNGNYGPAENIYSLYQFNFIKDDPDKIIIIEPNNYIRVYNHKTSKPIATLETNCGDFKEIPIKIKLKDIRYLGGFDQKITYQEYYTPRRFEINNKSNGQIFTIKKNKTNHTLDFTKLSLKGDPIDNIISVKPENDYINIVWKSKEISSDVLDFAFDKNGSNANIYVLVKNLDGYGVMLIK